MTEYKGKTNQVNEITLDSGIDRVVWDKGAASVGGKVGFSVDTHFVGNGSEMKIELKDSNGKSHGKFTDKIAGNKFWAEIVVPEKAEGSLVAIVKLPKHSAEMKSNPLVVVPRINIKNLKWDKTEARRGDILKITADIENVPDGFDAEVEIWEYDDDLAHDYITQIPVEVKSAKIETYWGFEYQEDTSDIPSDYEIEQGYNHPEYFFRVKALGVSEDSETLKFKDWIEIKAVDECGGVFANEEYKIIFADGSEKTGNLDENGFARIEDIPPGKFKVKYPKLEE